MASNIYTKSLIWLAASGGIAYFLMQITAPSEEKIKAIQRSSGAALNEKDKQKILFLQKIKQAANEEPIYLKSSKKE